MKLRAYLLIANAVSIAVILISLFVCYHFMLLTWNEVMLLGIVTVGATFVSFIVHFSLTRPLEASIRSMMEETARIAEGDFKGEVPLTGPQEFRQLSQQFNRMSLKLNRSFERLSTSEASRKELVANVSHDLRTPMASIQSFVEALQDDIIQDKETFTRYLQTIKLETRRLNHLINDLFALSQLQSGVYDFAPEPYHVDSLIVETLESYTIQLEEKNLDVAIYLPDDLPPVSVMPFEVKRVLSNLLQNAIRYSLLNGTITFRATSLPEDDFVKISVADEGEGIGINEQERIFDRFYRPDNSRNRMSGGSGLGLAIAKSIVDLHGGAIGVESKPGEGSRFWFTVPRAKADGM